MSGEMSESDRKLVQLLLAISGSAPEISKEPLRRAAARLEALATQPVAAEAGAENREIARKIVREWATQGHAALEERFAAALTAAESRGAEAGRGRRESVSPNARTISYFRSLGFKIGTVEQRLPIPGKFVTRDFIGIIDLIAFRPGVGIIGIQTTSGSNHAARMDKARANDDLADWLAAGGRFEVVSWSKTGARGKAKRWSVRREELTPLAARDGGGG